MRSREIPKAQSEVGLERKDNSSKSPKLVASLQSIWSPQFRKVATEIQGVRTSPGYPLYLVQRELFQPYPQNI